MYHQLSHGRNEWSVRRLLRTQYWSSSVRTASSARGVKSKNEAREPIANLFPGALFQDRLAELDNKMG